MTEKLDLVATLRAAGCVFAEDEADILLAAAQSPEELRSMVARRVEGLPLEQIVGWADFCGLRIVMRPGVFVPRRRTEWLVREVAAHTRAGSVMLDLGCGSGAVGAALLSLVEVELYAVDVDPAAVECARLNLPPERVLLGDLYEPLPERLRGRVDVIVANAPYVPSEEIASMPSEARDYEHLVALDGGVDGLSVQRRVVEGATGWLGGGGILAIESSETQAPQLAAAMRDRGLAARVSEHEDLGATVVIGQLGKR